MKKILYIIFFILMMTAVLGAECNWNETEVRNCDVTTNVTITGEHYIANVSVNQHNVDINLVGATLRHNESWGVKLNPVGDNKVFIVKKDNTRILCDESSVAYGYYVIGDPDDWNTQGGTTFVKVEGGTKKYNLTIQGCDTYDFFIPYNFEKTTVGLRFIGNKWNSTFVMTPFQGAGDDAYIYDNDMGGQMVINGNNVKIIGNRDLYPSTIYTWEDGYDYPHFQITDYYCQWDNAWNVSSFEIKDNSFDQWDSYLNCFVSGSPYNITNNTNFNWGYGKTAGSQVNGKIWNNSFNSLKLQGNPETLPSFCKDDVSNTYNSIWFWNEGKYDLQDFYCPTTTTISTQVNIQANNTYVSCNDMYINNEGCDVGAPLNIITFGQTISSYSPDNNVTFKNCKLSNGCGSAIQIYFEDIVPEDQVVMTNITIENVITSSTGDSLYTSSVKGLTLNNITTEGMCGAGLYIDGSNYAVSNVLINNSNFTGGACKGYNTFIRFTDGLIIENSVFDDNNELDESTGQSVFGLGGGMQNWNIHNNKFRGTGSVYLDGTGEFYLNDVGNVFEVWGSNVDICHNGDGNVYRKALRLMMTGSYALDSACNPLNVPEGLVVWQNLQLNGNGVNVTGTGDTGLQTFSSNVWGDNTSFNNVVENINLYGFTTSIFANVTSHDNLFKDIVITTAYEDNGVDNTFTNVSLLCFENWMPYYTLCNIGDNQTLYYLDSSMCGTYDDLPIDNSTISSCNYCSIAYHSVESACVNSQKTTTYVYDNYGTCCALTGIPADCNLPANTTEECSIFVHQASDITGVITDFVVEYALVLISVVAIIAIFVVFAYIGYII